MCTLWEQVSCCTSECDHHVHTWKSNDFCLVVSWWEKTQWLWGRVEKENKGQTVVLKRKDCWVTDKEIAEAFGHCFEITFTKTTNADKASRCLKILQWKVWKCSRRSVINFIQVETNLLINSLFSGIKADWIGTKSLQYLDFSQHRGLVHCMDESLLVQLLERGWWLFSLGPVWLLQKTSFVVFSYNSESTSYLVSGVWEAIQYVVQLVFWE